MNQKRLDKLKQLTISKYKIAIDDNDNVIVWNMRNKSTNKFHYKNSGTYACSLYDHSESKSWEYSDKELLLYAKGYDLLNKKTTEYIKSTPKEYKERKKVLCKVCGLTYPINEMIENVCYLCKEVTV